MSADISPAFVRAYEPVALGTAIDALRALGCSVSIGIGRERVSEGADEKAEFVSVMVNCPGGGEHQYGKGPHWLRMRLDAGDSADYAMMSVANAMLRRVREAMGVAA